MMVSRVKYQSKLIPYSEIVQVIVQITKASIASNQLGQIPSDFFFAGYEHRNCNIA